jgi:hypothetical protein
VNETDSEFDESPSSGGLFGLVDRCLGFWYSTERVLAVIAGLFLAGLFCLVPLTSFGADEPWYFWVASGIVALAASVLLAYVFFPPQTSKRARPRHDQSESDDP